ncbi:hypothetical protein ACFLTD_03645, partial [Elusimicrobiota bacterium]
VMDSEGRFAHAGSGNMYRLISDILDEDNAKKTESFTEAIATALGHKGASQFAYKRLEGLSMDDRTKIAGMIASSDLAITEKFNVITDATSARIRKLLEDGKIEEYEKLRKLHRKFIDSNTFLAPSNVRERLIDLGRAFEDAKSFITGKEIGVGNKMMQIDDVEDIQKEYDKVKELAGSAKDLPASEGYELVSSESSDEDSVKHAKFVNVLRLIKKNKKLARIAAESAGYEPADVLGGTRDNFELSDDKTSGFIRQEWFRMFQNANHPIMMEMYIREMAKKASSRIDVDPEDLLLISNGEALLMMMIAGAVNPLWAARLNEMNKDRTALLVNGAGSWVQYHVPDSLRFVSVEQKMGDFVETNTEILIEMITNAQSDRIDIGIKTEYDSEDDVVLINYKVMEKLVDLYKADRDLALNVMRAITAYERSRNSEGEENLDAFGDAMSKYLSKQDQVALVLWFEIYTEEFTEDQQGITKYVGKMLKGRTLAEIKDIRKRINKFNDMYMEGQKRITEAQDTGMVQPGKVKKALNAGARLAERFARIVKSLFNVTANAATMPSALAMTATFDNSFARLSAYALGEQKAKSLIDMLMEIARDISSRDDEQIFDDMRDVRELIQAT